MQAINDTLNNAFGQRQISTIYGQANQYRVDPGGDAGVPARPDARCRKLYVRRPASDVGAQTSPLQSSSGTQVR